MAEKPTRSRNQKTQMCPQSHWKCPLMESVSGVQDIKELIDSGTPVDILEGDGDNTMIFRIKSDLGITLKKRFDKNHVFKNIKKKDSTHFMEPRV